MLGFSFTGSRSATTAELHSLIAETTMSAFPRSAGWEIARRSSLSSGATGVLGGALPHRSSAESTFPLAPGQGELVDRPCVPVIQPLPPWRPGWQCLAARHRSCRSLGARAFRSPSSAGVRWLEVSKRITRRLPGLEIMQDIWPAGDGISEEATRSRSGGSSDIQERHHDP